MSYAAEALLVRSAAGRSREGADSSESQLLRDMERLCQLQAVEPMCPKAAGFWQEGAQGCDAGQSGAPALTQHDGVPRPPQCPAAVLPAPHGRQSTGLSPSPPGWGWDSPRSSTCCPTPTAARTRKGLSPIPQTRGAAEPPERPGRSSPLFSTGGTAEQGARSQPAEGPVPLGTNPRPAQQQPPLPPVRKGKALAPAGELQRRSLRTGAEEQGLAWTRWWGAAIPQTPGSVTSRAGVTATGFSPQPPWQERLYLLRAASSSYLPERAAAVWDLSRTLQGCPFLSSSCRTVPCRAQPRCWRRALLRSTGTPGERPEPVTALRIPPRAGASGSEQWPWVCQGQLGEPRMNRLTHRRRDGTAVLPQAPEGLQLQRERGLRVLQSPLARCSAGSIPTWGTILALVTDDTSVCPMNILFDSLLKCQYANTGSGISNYAAVRP